MKVLRWTTALGLSLCFGFYSACGVGNASETGPDLSFVMENGVPQVFAEPAAVMQGAVVRVVAGIAVEPPPDSPVSVLVRWRRVDKADSCGSRTVLLEEGGNTGLVDIDTRSMVPAQYLVEVILDPDDAIQEVDETNNLAAVRFQVNPVLPEVHPTSLDSYPGSPVPRGDTIHVDSEIRNSGDAASGPLSVRFALLPLSARKLVSAASSADATGAAGENAAPIIESIGAWTVGRGFPMEIPIAAPDPEGDAVEFHVVGLPAYTEVRTVEGGEAIVLAWSAVAEEAVISVYAYDEHHAWQSVEPLETRVETFSELSFSLSDHTSAVWILDAHNVPAELWRQIAIVPLPGLLAGGATRASTVIDTRVIDQLLSDTAGDVRASELRWSDGFSAGSETFALRADVFELDPPADTSPIQQDETNDGIVSFFTVAESSRERAELHPLRVTFNRDLPLEYNRSVGITVVAENTGSVPVYNVDVLFEYRYRGDSEWSRLDLVEDALTMSTEVGENTDSAGVSFGPICSNCGLTRPGIYDVRVTIDPPRPGGNDGGSVAEYDESNNSVVTSLTVEGAQLRVQGVDVAPSPALRGETLVVTAEIENLGLETTTGFVVAFYVDEVRVDSMFYGQDVRNNEDVFVVGRVRTEQFQPGAYVLRIVVDPDDAIPESDEADNVLSLPFAISEPEEPLPELYPTGLQVTPASPIRKNQVVECALTLRNVGDIDAGHFQISFLESHRIVVETGAAWTPFAPLPDVSGQPLFVELADLSRNRTVTVVARFDTEDLEETAYRLRAVVDSASEVAELDERNNQLMIGFTIGEPISSPPGPGQGVNLVCHGVGVSPATVDPGDEVEITSTVTNSGLDPAGPFRIALQWFDPYGNAYCLETRTVSGLGPMDSIPFSHSVDTNGFPSGMHQVCIQVDSDAQIDETDEDDNQCYGTVRVGTGGIGGQSDLVPVSVRFDSPSGPVGADNSVVQNQPLYAYVTVRNIGNIPSGPFNVAFQTSLGVDTESWTSIGPLDQTEISYPLPTGTPGGYALRVEVDPDGLIPEADEANNAIPNAYVPTLPAYTVVAVETPRPQAVVPASGGAGAVRWLAADPANDTVYAVSIDGRVRAVDANGGVGDVADLSGTVIDVDWSFSGTPYVYVGTAVGTGGDVTRVNLETGAAAGTAHVDTATVAVALGSTGRLYVAVAGGFHELALSGSDYSISRLVPIDGDVLDVQYDPDRSTIYVLSTSGLHAYGTDLSRLCVLDADELLGTPAVLTVASSGILIGTDAEGGGIVYAVSHCTVTSGSAGRILVGWRYRRTDTLAGGVSSIVIDPRDIDPIYVATGGGELHALGFDGSLQWPSYGAEVAIRSTPLADKRTGRLFFGDDAGIPHVLTLDGRPAFEVDLTGYSAGAIRSTLVILETRMRTEYGRRFVRTYYYGTEDGAVYRITSQQ